MSQPSPALVTQDAVRRLPRWALLLVCVAYVLPGYFGRVPWKNADIASFGYMLELLDSSHWGSWLKPTLMGLPADTSALLPYWLGAWAMQLSPAWIAPDFAARIPFVLMLGFTLLATWYAVYYLARQPGAQPVAFAFGGEAKPTDYARALADGSLLALIATLGLAQLSHETTPALAQLFFVSIVFYGLAAVPYRSVSSTMASLIGLPGLTLAGAPAMALIYGVVSILGLLDPRVTNLEASARWRALLTLLAGSLASTALALEYDLFRWSIVPALADWTHWRTLGRLFLWFTWPAWPLVLWTLWRWRRQLLDMRQHQHLGLPFFMALVPLLATVTTHAGDRSLLLSLPALAALAAFALPTFKRSASAFIDWFTVLFFSACAIAIWVVWLSLQTGIPPKPAANVARLAPGFEPSFHWLPFLAALAGTLAWGLLARWRTGRHRTALWKSLVLPASGATLCWLLLMTLWLPALDYGRSYAPQMREVRRIIGPAACVEVYGLSTPQISAVRFHGGWKPQPLAGAEQCPWLLVDVNAQASLPGAYRASEWSLVDRVSRPTDASDTLLLFKRVPPTR
ncbi:hypothetical protein [Ottowia caeni]|uniref:hypothetical protein n=1 Tax=Ottowia caeni TaxID=2870339 RepID=UPI001E5B5E72|nr:hypothetical protein [Ottowia caeni]